ncbi:Cyclic phosphodiesterase [Platanthera guangdongensis]|uniref:Cyclic phosphodiesterase n=1 Tax=Platanthera guangdongensis TaxID=2320717 RepID=A0ABR2N2Z7_9ASPA
MAETAKLEEADNSEEFFSVWAIPPPDVNRRFKSLMFSLRSEFGGPAFDPHITVVGDLRLHRNDAIAFLHSSAASINPFTARISAVSHGAVFYQCVYLLLDPSPQVKEISSHCCSHFGYKSSTPYMPHLSLIYGDLGEEEKERASKRAEEIDAGINGLTFEISSLALYRTDTRDKTTESWELVELCDLKK